MNFNLYIDYLLAVLKKIDRKEIENFIELIFNAYKDENSVFVIGNGGSAANASHFAQDLSKGTTISLTQIKRIKAISLTDNTPWITAIGNDNGYELIFEQQLRTFSNKKDIVVAISGSGNSPNIIKAVEWANNNNLITIGITGFNGGKLLNIAKHNIQVHLNDMCSSESIHSILFHYVILELQEKIKKFLKDEPSYNT